MLFSKLGVEWPLIQSFIFTCGPSQYTGCARYFQCDTPLLFGAVLILLANEDYIIFFVYLGNIFRGGGRGEMSGDGICANTALDMLFYCFPRCRVVDYVLLACVAFFDSIGSYIIDQGSFCAPRQ